MAVQSPRLGALLERARTRSSLRTAVVWPFDEQSLRATVEAAELGFIVPVLVGDGEKLRALAAHERIGITDFELVNVAGPKAAASAAVALALRSKVSAIMKGTLHTDDLMHAVVSEPGLRGEGRMSHVLVADATTYHKLLFITDAAVNVAPDLETKREIVQNAIDLAHALGIGTPKVAVLAAVETVNPHLPATLDAAALCKMAERGQITGGILDGPLAFDDAISREVACEKGIDSPVAGDVDILVVPELDAGNMLFKELEYLAGAECAGLVVGARVPVILTGRADREPARIASIALGVLAAR